jgi:RNA polymerase sigma-70 factor, ECF subfamily
MAIPGAVPSASSIRSIDAVGDSDVDWTLVQAVRAGSHDAVAALYDRHGSAVFAAAIRAGQDHSAAAEVVQETFLALWNRAEQFDPTRGSLRAWLLTIARNRAVDHFRAAARHDRAAAFSSFTGAEVDDEPVAEWLTRSGNLIGAAGPESTPEAALDDKETRTGMTAAIASLSPVEQSVILLAYEGGLTQAEIAARLGWPIGTVKTRTRRALRNLRSHLEPRAADAAEATPRARVAVGEVSPSRCPEWAPC